MKKLILILALVFALAFCFVACEDLGDNSKEGQSINALSNGAPETEEPTTEEPTSEEPTSEKPTSEKPTSEEPTSEEATTEEPISEEPTSEEPTSEESTSEELTTNIRVVDEYDGELNLVLAEILELTINKTNIDFSTNYKKSHYDLKNLGKYDGGKWTIPNYSIHIIYDGNLARNTEWYQRVENKDRKNLSNSFCEAFSDGFKNSNSLCGSVIFDGMILSYTSNEGLLADLNYILEISDLEYISEISIVYEYSLPEDYLLE